MEEEGTN